MSENNSFKKNTLMLTTGTIINKGLQFLVIPFFSRWLTTEEYGQFDLLCTYISLLIPVISLSTHEAVFRFNVEETDIKKQKINITNGFIINLINFAILLIVSIFFVNKVRLTIYVCFMLYLSTELFSTYLRGYLRSIKRIDIYSLSMTFTTILMTFFVTLFVLVCKWGLEGILLGYAVGTLTGNILLCTWGKWTTMLCFKGCSIYNMKMLVQYSIPLIPNDISWWVMNASDRQIINIFFNDAANGVYAIAHKIPALCQVIFNMFSVSWQQEIVKKIDSPDVNEFVDDIFNKFLVMLLTVCSGLLAGSFLLYYYIFDLKYFEAIHYSPILLFSAVIIAISQFLGGIQIALKRTIHNGMTTVIGAVCNVLIHLLLIDKIGLFAASISTLVSNVLIVVLRMILLRKKIIIHLKKESVFALVMHLYFFINSYLHRIIWIDICNLSFSCIIFCIFNRKWVFAIWNKILCMIKHNT